MELRSCVTVPYLSGVGRMALHALIAVIKVTVRFQEGYISVIIVTARHP